MASFGPLRSTRRISRRSRFSASAPHRATFAPACSVASGDRIAAKAIGLDPALVFVDSHFGVAVAAGEQLRVGGAFDLRVVDDLTPAARQLRRKLLLRLALARIP